MKTIHSNIPRKSTSDKLKSRAQIDLLRDRIELLEDKDRLMMTMYLDSGYNAYQISRMTGICRTKITRRIKRLIRHLLDGKYIACLRNRNKFNKKQMTFAKDYFLTGLSIKKISIKRNCSRYSVSENLKKINRILNENGCSSEN